MLKPPEGEPAGELDFGLKLYKVGSYQFRERRTEAEEKRTSRNLWASCSTRNWRQLWIRDCCKNQACPAHGIARSSVRDFGQSASAT